MNVTGNTHITAIMPGLKNTNTYVMWSLKFTQIRKSRGGTDDMKEGARGRTG